jgi:hypothetical protein
VSAISDSVNGSAWQKVLSLSHSSGGAQEISLWSVVSAAGTPGSITVTFAGHTGGFGIGIACGAYRGLSTATDGSEIDISKISSGSGTTTADSGTTVATTTAANELKIGFAGDFGGGATQTAGTLDTTYSIFVNDSPNGNSEVSIEDADSGSSGATARATVSQVAAGGWGMGVAVIKLAGGAAQDTPELRGRPFGQRGQSQMHQLLAQ